VARLDERFGEHVGERAVLDDEEYVSPRSLGQG
jgi:hypothetical protein